MSIRDEIIEAMARNLHVQAYADYMDEAECDEDRSDLDRACGGQDWDDHSPETTQAAKDAAAEYAVRIEAMNNGWPLDRLYASATLECSIHGGCTKRHHSPEHFGSDLGMMLTGTGVSWSDDHARTGEPKTPDIEFHYFSRAEFESEE